MDVKIKQDPSLPLKSELEDIKIRPDESLPLKLKIKEDQKIFDLKPSDETFASTSGESSSKQISEWRMNHLRSEAMKPKAIQIPPKRINKLNWPPEKIQEICKKATKTKQEKRKIKKEKMAHLRNCALQCKQLKSLQKNLVKIKQEFAMQEEKEANETKEIALPPINFESTEVVKVTVKSEVSAHSDANNPLSHAQIKNES